MKFKHTAILILAVASLSIQAFGQVDYFAQPKTVIVSSPQLVGGNLTFTNSWVDIRTLNGIGKLDVSDYSVAGANGITFAIQQSVDQTNLTTLANVAIATSTSIIYTNMMYGSTNNLTATDTFQVAGTVTQPVAATAGWNISYILPAPFTNSATGLTLSSNSITTFGFKVDDASRYVRIIWSQASATTNVVSAVLTAQ